MKASKEKNLYLPVCMYMYHSLFLFYLKGSGVKAASSLKFEHKERVVIK